MNLPTQKEIQSQFLYKDGALYRKKSGKRGYRDPKGYVRTRVNGKSYFEHRLIHFMFSGEAPEQVDHINGNPSDNRPENLRSATHAENCRNRKPMGAPHKGCYWIKGRMKWMVQIGHQGKRATIGYYKTLGEAANAYDQKAKELFGEYARVE